MKIRTLLFLTLSITMMIQPIMSVVGHGGGDSQTNSTTDDSEISLTLEQIYFITFFAAVLLALALMKLGILKNTDIVKKLLIVTVLFLTGDYLIFRYYL